MTTEQIYTLAMMQLALVMLVASTRVAPPKQDVRSLRLFQLAVGCDALSWFFYLWPIHPILLLCSSLAAATNFWLLLAFALARCDLKVHWSLLWPMVVLQAGIYTQLNLNGMGYASLHFMTLVTACVTFPVAWLFWFKKLNRTVSDQGFALVMLSWFLICVLRTVTVEIHEDWILSGYLVSQVLWPGIMAAYGLLAITGYLEETQQRLKAEAVLDPLTGQLNRRGLNEVVTSSLSYLQRNQQPAALLMVDLDHFKRVNDQFGHDGGDLVLVQTAQAIKAMLRQSDVLARFGGEEFLIFLPAANLQMATTTAQRLLDGIRQLEWPASMPEDYQLTISIGVSVFGPDYDFGRQLRLADQALYRAKLNGRDRIEFAGITAAS
ncbi:MAG: GGDEF domain-containing protein [Rheinheimera sp.]|nr:GGDEF domain-containing protein [Rheinheimera sp.]